MSLTREAGSSGERSQHHRHGNKHRLRPGASDPLPSPFRFGFVHLGTARLERQSPKKMTMAAIGHCLPKSRRIGHVEPWCDVQKPIVRLRQGFVVWCRVRYPQCIQKLICFVLDRRQEILHLGKRRCPVIENLPAHGERERLVQHHRERAWTGAGAKRQTRLLARA